MKKKKSIIGIIALVLVAVVGATFAYYTSNTSFENVFNTGKYKVKVVEEFVSPDNWVPGETIDKTVTAKNEGDVDAAVRISYIEKWETQEGTDITDQIDSNPAIINFSNTSDWTLNNGYYYYNYILKPDDVSNSFISGVTLDPALNGVTCTGEGNERTCEAQNSIGGAKYKLTITIETAQADKYKEIWNTNVNIEEKSVVILPIGRTKDNLQVGDEICIEGTTTECFNFIGYEDNDIKMLAKWNLNVGNNPKGEATNLQDSDVKGMKASSTTYGNVAFSATYHWNDNGLKPKYGSSYPADIYDADYKTEPDFSNAGYNTTGYSIAYYVEEYKDILESYGATIKEARLLKYSEATDASIGCSLSPQACPTNSFITNTSYWTSQAQNQSILWIIASDGSFGTTTYTYSGAFGVRPVIVISKNNI